MSNRRFQLGLRGELIAQCFLRKEGFNIIASNYFFSGGELDIVALKDGFIVFVEVKTRTSDLYGDIRETVTSRKIRNMIRGASNYCTRFKQGFRGYIWRFDCIFVYLKKQKPEIFHYEDIYGFL